MKKLITCLNLLLFLFTIGVGQMWGTTFTTTNSGGFSGTNKSKTTDGITVTFSSDASWQNGHVRVYQSGTISFSCSSPITSIVMTATGESYARNFNASRGSCSTSSSTITWTGSGTSITLTLPSGGQVRLTQIVVTVSESCSTKLTLTHGTPAPSNGSFF